MQSQTVLTIWMARERLTGGSKAAVLTGGISGMDGARSVYALSFRPWRQTE